MKYIKRISILAILASTVNLLFITTTNAADQPTPPGETTPNVWYDGNNEGYGKGFNKKVGHVGVIGTDHANTTDASILDTIQTAINWVLGMLSLVALVLCLWGGFQMLTAGGDDGKVKTGTKILKNAGIGLAVIGLAWLIVSFVFRIVNKTTGG